MTEMSNAPNSWRDWTTRGGEVDSGFADRLDRLEKRWRNHLGIDWSAAGPDYPHPSQKVRALYFFEGNGRLDPKGIQFVNTPANSVITGGLFWNTAFSDTPTNAVPLASIYGDTANSDGTNLTLNSWQTLSNKAYLLLHSDISGLNADNYMEVDIGGGVQLSLSGLRFQIWNVPLLLVGETADFATLTNGMLFYRSDTGKFRARIAGVTENLATESYVTAAIAAIPADQDNIWPYVAKTTTYTTLATDGFVRADATSASFTITLITAVGNTGLIQVFKKIDATNNTVTIDASSTQTIDGALTYVLSAEDQSCTIISDGANWHVIASSSPAGYGAKTSTYTVLPTDTYLTLSAGSSFTTTLYPAAGNAGRVITFIKINSTNVATIDGSGAETINGLTTYALTDLNQYVTLLCTGAAWLVIGEG